jgi:mannose-6-phosphate isomerase-like protein (cupin superfamily)
VIKLSVGLNAFEPGQEHAPHVHEGQDKLYFFPEGTGVVHMAEILSAGDAAYAASGVPHSIRNPRPARLVTTGVLAPPPQK